MKFDMEGLGFDRMKGREIYKIEILSLYPSWHFSSLEVAWFLSFDSSGVGRNAAGY